MRDLCRVVVAIVVLLASAAAGSGTHEQDALLETTMDHATFVACGLGKLTEEELANLNAWVYDALAAVCEDCKKANPPAGQRGAPKLRRLGDLEEALIVKDFDGGSLIIERPSGEKWILESKTWCSWSWLWEGRTVLLKFGYVSSTLINGDGDGCDFWTGDPLD